MKTTTVVAALTVFLSLQGMAFAGFTNNGDGTVTDTATNLMWQQQDDGVTKPWADAVLSCRTLSLGGHDDWRMPNVKELKSIIDTSRTGLLIDTTFFLNTKAPHYWSSSTDVHSPTTAWAASFSLGNVETIVKAGGSYVRCVR